MQNEGMNLKIQMFGNLIEELNYWHQACEDEESPDELDYCEQMFIDTLSAVKEMREVLLEDFIEYRNDCKSQNIPIDMGYFRVEKQLKESTFSLVRT